MNRRDFLKACAALGVSVSLPVHSTGLIQVPVSALTPDQLHRISSTVADLDWISRFDAFGVLDPFGARTSRRAEGAIRRGSVLLLPFQVNLLGGFYRWQASLDDPIIVTDDLRIDVDPEVVVKVQFRDKVRLYVNGEIMDAPYDAS